VFCSWPCSAQTGMIQHCSCCISRADATDVAGPVISQTLRSQSQCVAAETQDVEVPECTICLEVGSPHVRLQLSCGHIFCRPCLTRYVQHEQHEQRVASCPNCNNTLQRDELCMCLPDAEVDQLIADAAERMAATHRSQDEPLVDLPGLKCCPNCNVRIEKNGGCDHMRCRCGHKFNWSEVPFAGKCDCALVGARPGGSPWGRTCAKCSWEDVGRLTVWRTCLVGAVVVIVPIVLAYRGAKYAGESIVAGAHSTVAACTIRGACVDEAAVMAAQRVEAAQSRQTEAEAHVRSATQDLVREEKRWFNNRAVRAAKARLDARREQLHAAQSELREATLELRNRRDPFWEIDAGVEVSA